jgi:DNA invertase Pin-like site-specific DNA recombinase
MAAAEQYAARHGLILDRELTFQDEGVSAYHGRNAEVGALGTFLEAVRYGVVPHGSYLLVESLDRVSRQTVRKAVRTLEDIVEAGVNVVDLSDGGKVYNVEALDSDGMAFLMMTIRFMRAHEESATKARRVLAAYEHKRSKLRNPQGGHLFTRRLPAWLRWNESAQVIEEIPERAAIIRDIFKKAASGWGQHRIARWLNSRKVDTWGDGKRKAALWHRTYVSKILSSTAVVGTFTPHRVLKGTTGARKRKPLDPVVGYFPAIVDRENFDCVAARMSSLASRGRHANREPRSIFAGVMRCEHCGSTVTRVAKGKHVYLVCTRANSKADGCRYVRSPTQMPKLLSGTALRA